MKHEVRMSGAPVEVRAENDTVTVEGYAAVFGEETDIGGMFREVIAPGAFSEALSRGDDVVFLVNHDDLPLGRTRSGTLQLSQDDKGLLMRAELDGSDPDVARLVPKMRRGDLDKMSFAFIPERQEWDETGDTPLRTIQSLRLYDVSIVTTPAYEGTEIGLRSLEEHRAKQEARHNYENAKRRRLMRMRQRMTTRPA